MLKKAPGKHTYATGGIGTSPHLSGEMFKQATGVEMPHVPYRGSAPTMTDIAAGQVGFAIDGVAVSAPMIEAGQLRGLAATAPRRVQRFPQVPTTAEAGLEGLTVSSWFGLVAPGGTPFQILHRLRDAALAGMSAPEVQRAMRAASAEQVASTPEAFDGFISAETSRYRLLAARTRISIE